MTRPTKAEIRAMYARNGSPNYDLEAVESVDGDLLEVRIGATATWQPLDPDQHPAMYGYTAAEWADPTITE